MKAEDLSSWKWSDSNVALFHHETVLAKEHRDSTAQRLRHGSSEKHRRNCKLRDVPPTELLLLTSASLLALLQVGDFGILVRAGFSVTKALALNFLSASMAMAGTALALVVGGDASNSSIIEVRRLSLGFLQLRDQ